MKRKTIIFSIIILVCAGLYFVCKHCNRVENRVLRNVTFNEEFGSFAKDLCLEYKLPVVFEYSNYYQPPDRSPRISYSAKKTTLRELLDAVVPKNDFIWTTNGKVIHIISRTLASRPDYQMNSVIEHFSAKNVDRNTLIKSAIAYTENRKVSEPLIYSEVPYKRYNIKFDPPKISIDAKQATLREVLDQISRKADFCYTVERAPNSDVSFSSYVPIGSYALWLWLPDDLPTFEELESAKIQQSSNTAIVNNQ